MRVLIVGSGGREHALAWRLARDGGHELHAAPGNPGIAGTATCHPVRADDGDGLLELATALGADLAVIGPEAPLVAGVGDRLRHGGFPVFGPSAAAARIEGSKSFAKEVLEAAGVPTARALSDPAPPCVVKADGLAAGKGVFVCRTQEELEAGLAAARAIGGHVVVEELLEGEELSVFALCDGRRAFPLAAARDYKRVGDGDTGPNTGGMGSFSPVPGFDSSEVEELVDRIHAARGRGAGPARGTVHRRALRRADADRGRAAGARVQLPVRRPGDAVAAAAGSTATSRLRSPRPRRAGWEASSSASTRGRP